MSETPTGMIVELYRETHKRVLKLIEDLSDDQLAWRPTPTAHSIGFNLWHLARWADHLKARLGSGPQLWEEEGLAEKWGLDSSTLGYDETGMEMDHDAAVRLCLALPGKDILLDYARSAFAAVEAVIGALDEGNFWKPRKSEIDGSDTSIGRSISVHLTHANRHLGQIEFLHRAQGLRGSATK